MPDRRHQDRRAFFRLRYPPAERPVLHVGDREYVVLDLSEGGARVAVPADPGLAAGDAVEGVVRFRTGEQAGVKGTALRVEGGQAALQFAVGVGQRRMVAEQRRLLREYPGLFRGSGGEGSGPSAW